MTDKTIRYNVDGAPVKKLMDDVMGKATAVSAANRKLNKDELVDLEKKLKLLKELQRQQEENYRAEIARRQVSIQGSELELRQYIEKRKNERERLVDSGASADRLKGFDVLTSEKKRMWEQNLLRDRIDVTNTRKQYQETQDNNKKQLSELRNITDTIKGEGGKSRQETGTWLSRLQSGAPSMMTGGLGGIASGGLMMLGAGGLAAMLASMLINTVKERQNALVNFAAVSDISNSEAVMRSASFRHVGLGLDPITSAQKALSYSRASGLDLTGSGKDVFGIAGLQIARGFSDQQIQQLLAIQRYSGKSIFGQTSNLEEYTRRRDGNIIKLPELIDQYLKTANEILNRTGQVNPESIQRILTSVGSSYGVSGVPLDRMASGIMNLGKDQGSGVMRAFRMETLRKMYPGMSTWEMMGRMEDPTRDPRYLKEVVNQATKFGGGGDWTKFFLMQQGFSFSEVNKLMKGDFQLSAGGAGDSSDKALEDKYLQEGITKVGDIQSLETAVGGLTDAVSQLTTSILNGDLKSIMLVAASPIGSVIAKAIQNYLDNRRP